MKLSFVCLALIAVTLMSGVAHGAGGLVGNKLSAQMRARSSLSANPRHQSHGGFSTQNVKALFESKKKKAETEEAEVSKASEAVAKKEASMAKGATEKGTGAMKSPPAELKGSVEMGGVSQGDLNTDQGKKTMKKEIAESLGVTEDKVQDVQVEAGSRRRRLLGGTRGAKVTYKVKNITEEDKSKAEANAKNPKFKEDMKKGAKAATGKTATVKAVEAGPPPLPKNCGEVMTFIAEHPGIPEKMKSMFHLAGGKTASSTCDFGKGGGTCIACVEIRFTCGKILEMMKESMPPEHAPLPYASGKTASTTCKMTKEENTCMQCFDMPGPKNCGDLKKFMIEQAKDDGTKKALENMAYAPGITANTKCSGQTCSKCFGPDSGSGSGSGKPQH